VVSVSESSLLSAGVEQSAFDAAGRAGAAAAAGRSAQVGMTTVRRGTTFVQQAPTGYRYPMGVTVLPVDAVAHVMGDAVAATLAAGQVVWNADSASMRGALAGDVITLLDPNDNPVDLVIGRVATDAEVGGAELVMRPEEADRLGITRDTRVLIWGPDSHDAIDQALSAAGLDRAGVRISRSWDIPSPDSGLGLVRTKVLLGEFPFKPLASGQVNIPAEWTDSHLHARLTFSDIAIRATCHNVVVPAIQGALSEIAAAGLGGLVDLSSTNQYGGCYNPRLNRITGNIGFLSRHAWAMALDMNITQNPQGSRPRLDCRIVQIFRKWGFAWGGNFTTPDGMHMEYVGERRDLLAGPVTYCPNVSTTSADHVDPHESSGAAVAPPPSVLFADDGLPQEGP